MSFGAGAENKLLSSSLYSEKMEKLKVFSIKNNHDYQDGWFPLKSSAN
jgi:hypothetical protein